MSEIGHRNLILSGPPKGGEKYREGWIFLAHNGLIVLGDDLANAKFAGIGRRIAYPSRPPETDMDIILDNTDGPDGVPVQVADGIRYEPAVTYDRRGPYILKAVGTVPQIGNKAYVGGADAFTVDPASIGFANSIEMGTVWEHRPNGYYLVDF